MIAITWSRTNTGPIGGSSSLGRPPSLIPRILPEVALHERCDLL